MDNDEKFTKQRGRKGKKAEKDEAVTVFEPADSEKESEAGEPCDCGKTVTSKQKALKCDSCQFWHHATYEKVKDEIYNFLYNNAEETTGLLWYCKKCLVMHQRMFMTVIEMKQNQIKIEEKMDAVLAWLNEKGLQVEDMQSCVEGALEVKIKEDKEENAERERRKGSLIVHGLPDSKEQEAGKRIEEDRGRVEALINRFVHSDLPVKQVIRLGKSEVGNNDKARPLKVVLKSKDHRNQIFSEAKNLKSVK